MPSVIRLGVVGLAFLFVLVGTSLLWNVYSDKSRENTEKYFKQTIEYTIFVPWLVVVACGASAYLFEINGNLSDVFFILAFGGFFVLFSAMNLQLQFAPFSFDRASLIRSALKFLQDNDKQIPDQDDQITLYEKELGGIVMSYIGMIAALLACCFRIGFRADGSVPRLIALAVSVVCAFIGMIILWSAGKLVQPGNGVSIQETYGSDQIKYSFAGDEPRSDIATPLYGYSGATFCLMITIIIGVLANHKGAAVATLGIGAIEAFFGISTLLAISGALELLDQVPSSIVGKDDMDAARSGIIFCYFSILASIAAAALVYMQESLGAATKYSEA